MNSDGSEGSVGGEEAMRQEVLIYRESVKYMNFFDSKDIFGDADTVVGAVYC